MDRVLPVAEETRALYRQFRSQAKSVFAALKQVRATGGQLVVEEIMAANRDGPRGIRTRGSTVDTRQRSFGQLRGLTATASDFNPVKPLLELRAAALAHTQPSEEACLAYITERGDGHRATVYRELRKASDDFKRVLNSLDDFREFFSGPNFTNLSAWSAHPDAPLRFIARLIDRDDGTRRITFQLPGELFSYAIPQRFWTRTAHLTLARAEAAAA